VSHEAEDFVDDAALAEEVADTILSFLEYAGEERLKRRGEMVVWLLGTPPGRSMLQHMRQVDELAPPAVPRVKRPR